MTRTEKGLPVRLSKYTLAGTAEPGVWGGFTPPPRPQFFRKNRVTKRTVSSAPQLKSLVTPPPPPWKSVAPSLTRSMIYRNVYMGSFTICFLACLGLYELWKTGRYKSYPPNTLVDLIARILALVPPWTRVYRVQRLV